MKVDFVSSVDFWLLGELAIVATQSSHYYLIKLWQHYHQHYLIKMSFKK